MKRKHGIILAVCLALAAIVAGGVFYVLRAYEVRDIQVDGNIHYTDEEIASMVLDGALAKNSLYLTLRYRDRSITDIPFVEKMDVTILSPHAIRINVYEKALAGYIAYLDRYLYFDREGIVVETSYETTKGIPEVKGLSFQHAVLYEPLPVENTAVFQTILDLTQLLNKYELEAERIFFDSSYDVFLYFDEIEVSLGNTDYEERIIRLKTILPQLAGKKGIVKMRDYDRNTNNITFEEIEN